MTCLIFRISFKSKPYLEIYIYILETEHKNLLSTVTATKCW